MKSAIAMVLCVGMVFIGMFIQAVLDRHYLKDSIELCKDIAYAEANLLLKIDGYSIYFRTTEHGQLALVHQVAFNKERVTDGSFTDDSAEDSEDVPTIEDE